MSDEPDCNYMSYGVGYQQIHHLRRELREHDYLIKGLASKLTELEYHIYYEEELIEQNAHLSVHAKLPSTTEASSLNHGRIIFHTIDNGKQYTPALRALYN